MERLPPASAAVLASASRAVAQRATAAAVGNAPGGPIGPLWVVGGGAGVAGWLPPTVGLPLPGGATGAFVVAVIGAVVLPHPFELIRRL